MDNIYDKGDAFFGELGFSKSIDKVFSSIVTQQEALGAYKSYCSVVIGGDQDREYTSNEGIDRPEKWANGKAVPKAKRYAGYTVKTTAEWTANSLEITYQDYHRAMKSGDSRVKLLESMLDNTRDLSIGMYAQLEEEGATLFNGAFTTVLAPDTKTFIATDHSWKRSGTTAWSNRIDVGGTLNKELSIDALKEVNKRFAAFKDASGKLMPLKADVVIVKAGSSAEAKAKELFTADGNFTANEQGNVNIYRNQIKTIISVDYMTSDTAYFFADSRYFKKALKAHIYHKIMMDKETKDYETKNSKRDIMGAWTFDLVDLPYAIQGSKGTNAA